MPRLAQILLDETEPVSARKLTSPLKNLRIRYLEAAARTLRASIAERSAKGIGACYRHPDLRKQLAPNSSDRELRNRSG